MVAVSASAQTVAARTRDGIERSSTTANSTTNGTITTVGLSQSHGPMVGAAPPGDDGPNQMASASAPTKPASASAISAGGMGARGSTASTVSSPPAGAPSPVDPPAAAG